jgi:hypothetical protein
MVGRFTSLVLLTLTIASPSQDDRAAAWARLNGGTLFLALESDLFDLRLRESMNLLAPEVRADYQRRLTRRRTYRPANVIPPRPSSPEQCVLSARGELETAIVVLLATPELPASARRALEGEAAAYARRARLSYEWEGYPDGPLNEAKFAEEYLGLHPTSRLRPYLELFLLHRYRSAFEAARYEVNEVPRDILPAGRTIADIQAGYAADQRFAAAKYREVWTRLAATTDPVVRAIADELDGVSFVYLSIGAHPRR